MSTSRHCAIFISISRFGWALFCTHFETVGPTPSCSDSHLLVKFFSAIITRSLFNCFGSILHKFEANIPIKSKYFSKLENFFQLKEKFNSIIRSLALFGIFSCQIYAIRTQFITSNRKPIFRLVDSSQQSIPNAKIGKFPLFCFSETWRHLGIAQTI